MQTTLGIIRDRSYLTDFDAASITFSPDSSVLLPDVTNATLGPCILMVADPVVAADVHAQMVAVVVVVSLDATHLRSEHKGTLYVASILSGCNDIFPIGFMICTGNEDGATWKKCLNC